MSTQQFESWTQPEGASLEEWLNPVLHVLKLANMTLTH